ncbi:MAG: protein-disulfide reductase DsbD [Gammaproteobacteria bacterium]
MNLVVQVLGVNMQIKGFRFLWLLGLALYATISFAAHEKPLPAEQAFVFSAVKADSQKIVARWKIAPNYYLYAKRLQINVDPSEQVKIHYPKGKWKKSPLGIQEEVYFKRVLVPIDLPPKVQTATLSVDYQGCSQHGFCYPPVHKEVSIVLNAKPETAFSLSSMLTDQQGVLLALQTQHYPVLLLFFLGLGLLFAFTPCVLPMIPILTAIIVGQHATGTKKSFFLAFTYVLGMATAYAMAGVAAAAMGSSVQVWLQKGWVIGLMSGIVLLLALSLFEWYDLRFSRRWHNFVSHWSQRHKGGNYIGVFSMGVLSTLVVSPCITAPLMGVLIYISQTGNVFLGGGALFALGLGMGIPLILIGMSANKWLPKSGAWMNAVRKMMGFCMLALAIWMLSRILMPVTIMLLWGLLLFILAAFFYVSMPKYIGRRHMNRGIGMFAAVMGVFVILSGTNALKLNYPQAAQSTSMFTVVRNIESLKQQLASAAAKGQPVLLDFYADWCESCLVMDEKVFKQSDVQMNLKQYRLLRADLTNNNEADAEILKAYQVIAPPTILFFDPRGQEINSQRVVGEVGAKEFLSRLTTVKSCHEKTTC